MPYLHVLDDTSTQEEHRRRRFPHTCQPLDGIVSHDFGVSTTCVSVSANNVHLRGRDLLGRTSHLACFPDRVEIIFNKHRRAYCRTVYRSMTGVDKCKFIGVFIQQRRTSRSCHLPLYTGSSGNIMAWSSATNTHLIFRGKHSSSVSTFGGASSAKVGGEVVY